MIMVGVKLFKIFLTTKNNDFINPIYENCVGTNFVFVNTRQEKDVDDQVVNISKPLIIKLIKIINPKHIIVLGRVPWRNLITSTTKTFMFGDVKFETNFHNNIPIAYVPNPSGLTNKYYSNGKIFKWQKAIEEFLRDNLK